MGPRGPQKALGGQFLTHDDPRCLDFPAGQLYNYSKDSDSALSLSDTQFPEELSLPIESRIPRRCWPRERAHICFPKPRHPGR